MGKPISVDFDALLPHIGEFGRYQLGLYLLMCIPATLPAAFLAFNQVFLSAEPDHWCRVSAVQDHNLTEEHVKALTIPLTDQGQGRIVYKRCAQFDVNFTDVFERSGGVWPAAADPSWPESDCKEGWMYDTSEYQETLVTQVRLINLHAVCRRLRARRRCHSRLDCKRVEGLLREHTHNSRQEEAFKLQSITKLRGRNSRKLHLRVSRVLNKTQMTNAQRFSDLSMSFHRQGFAHAHIPPV
jgi:hypothetical protein